MAESLPLALESLVAALDARSYSVIQDSLVDTEGDALILLQLAEDFPGGRVGMVRMNDEWTGLIGFGTTLCSADAVMLAMEGLEPDDPGAPPPLEEQVRTCLSAIDRLHSDRAARARAVSRLSPAPLDADLGGKGNDPCWCGSGRKLKRCHAASPPA